MGVALSRRLALMATLALPLAMSVPAPKAVAQEGPGVLMVLWRGITEPEQAFKKRLEEKGVKVTYKEITGDQDRAKMAEAMRNVEPDIAAGKFKVAYSFGSTATQVAQSVIAERVPIVFNIVFDPVGVKLVDSLQKPGKNTTGVTNGVAIEAQFDAFQKLTPIKKLVVLFNAREPNSNIIEKEVTAWAAKNKVEVVSHRVAPGDTSLDTFLADMKEGKITGDALYAGADSFLGSKAADIQAAVGDKIKLLGGTQTFVLRGWLAAFTPTVQDMGATAADQVIRVLNGEKAGDLPVILPTPKMIVSQAAADKHGVKIPAGAVVEK